MPLKQEPHVSIEPTDLPLEAPSRSDPNSMRPRPSSKARLWDRLLMVSEIQHQRVRLNSNSSTSTKAHHTTRRRSNAKSSAVSAESAVSNQQRKRGEFTFAPRDPGDHHLRQSFENALIHEGLHVSADFKLVLNVPPDREKEKPKKKNVPSTSRAKRARGVSTSSIVAPNNVKVEVDPARRKSGQFQKRSSIRSEDGDDDDDDGIILQTARRSNVVPLSKLPPSDLPLIRMKEQSISTHKEEGASKPMSVRERLLADQQADRERKLAGAAAGMVGPSANSRQLYSGSYRVPGTSPAGKRRLSKTARTKNNEPPRSIEPPPEVHQEPDDEIIVVDDDDDDIEDNIRPLNWNRPPSSKKKGMLRSSKERETSQTRRRRHVIFDTDEDEDEEGNIRTVNDELFDQPDLIRKNGTLHVDDDAMAGESLSSEGEQPPSKPTPASFVPAEDVLWITQPPSPSSGPEKASQMNANIHNSKTNQSGKQKRKYFNSSHRKTPSTVDLGASKDMRNKNGISKIYLSSDEEDEDAVDPRDSEWHPVETNLSSMRCSKNSHNDSSNLRRSRRSRGSFNNERFKYSHVEEEIDRDGRRTYNSTRNKQSSQFQGEGNHRRSGRRQRVPKRSHDEQFTPTVQILNDEEYNKYFNSGSVPNRNSRKRKLSSPSNRYDHEDEVGMEVHVAGADPHLDSVGFEQGPGDNFLGRYQSGNRPRRASKKQKNGKKHVDQRLSRRTVQYSVKDEPSEFRTTNDLEENAFKPETSRNTPNAVEIGVVSEAYEITDTDDDVPLTKFLPIPVIVIDDDDEIHDASGDLILFNSTSSLQLKPGRPERTGGLPNGKVLSKSIHRSITEPLTSDKPTGTANQNGRLARENGVNASIPRNGPVTSPPYNNLAPCESLKVETAPISSPNGVRCVQRYPNDTVQEHQVSSTKRLPPAMTAAYVPPYFSVTDGLNGSPTKPGPPLKDASGEAPYREPVDISSIMPFGNILNSVSGVTSRATPEPLVGMEQVKNRNQVNGVAPGHPSMPVTAFTSIQEVRKDIKCDNLSTISFPKALYPRSSSVGTSAYLPLLFPASIDESGNDTATNLAKNVHQNLNNTPKDPELGLLPPSYYLGVFNSETNFQSKESTGESDMLGRTNLPNVNYQKPEYNPIDVQVKSNETIGKKRKHIEAFSSPVQWQDLSPLKKKLRQHDSVKQKRREQAECCKHIPLTQDEYPRNITKPVPSDKVLLRLRVRKTAENKDGEANGKADIDGDQQGGLKMVKENPKDENPPDIAPEHVVTEKLPLFSNGPAMSLLTNIESVRCMAQNTNPRAQNVVVRKSEVSNSSKHDVGFTTSTNPPEADINDVESTVEKQPVNNESFPNRSIDGCSEKDPSFNSNPGLISQSSVENQKVVSILPSEREVSAAGSQPRETVSSGTIVTLTDIAMKEDDKQSKSDTPDSLSPKGSNVSNTTGAVSSVSCEVPGHEGNELNSSSTGNKGKNGKIVSSDPLHPANIELSIPSPENLTNGETEEETKIKEKGSNRPSSEIITTVVVVGFKKSNTENDLTTETSTIGTTPVDYENKAVSEITTFETMPVSIENKLLSETKTVTALPVMSTHPSVKDIMNVRTTNTCEKAKNTEQAANRLEKDVVVKESCGNKSIEVDRWQGFAEGKVFVRLPLRQPKNLLNP